MKKSLMIVASLIIAISLLLLSSALILSHFVNPNNYKGRISQFVYAKTGQVLVINGDIQWSLFPWIGLRVHDLTYYNPPGYSPKPFISAKEMHVKVKLLPLATGKIEVGNVTLDKAVVNVIKNKNNKFNWQSDNQDGKTSENSPKIQLTHLSISSVKINNSQLNYYDQSQPKTMSLTGLTIHSKGIQFGKPFPLMIKGNFVDKNQKKQMQFLLHTDVTITPDQKNYAFHGLSVKGQYLPDNQKLDLKLNGNLNVDLQKSILRSDATIDLQNLHGQLTLNGDALDHQPHFSGTLTIDPFNLRQFLEHVNNPIETRDASALQSVSLLAKIDANNGTITLSDLHAKIDKTDVLGNVHILTENTKIKFNLSANSIVLDDYLSNQEDETPAVNEPRNETPSLWTETGTLKIAELTYHNMKLNAVSANISRQHQVTQIAPLQANLYQGTLNGNITIDKRQPTKTAIYIKQSLNDIDIKALLHTFSESDKLSGRTNLSVDVVSITDPHTSFLSALNGNIQLTMTQGALKGVDVIYQLSRAHAFLKQLPSPSISDSKETAFDSFTANGVITNGVMHSDNLLLKSDYLNVSGKGIANLQTKELNYRLNALAQPKLAKENKEIGNEVTIYQVPIKVSGKFTKPSVNLDFATLTKTFLKKQLEKPLEKNLNHIKDEISSQVQQKVNELSPLKLLDKLTKSKSSAPVVDGSTSPDVSEASF